MATRGKPIPQAQLDPDLQRRRATWQDTVIEDKVLYDFDISEDMIHKALSIAPNVEHPLWDGLGAPGKNAVAYMSALQGKHGRLFASSINRTTENYVALVKGQKEGQRIDNQPYASSLEWWRKFLVEQKLALVLPFPLHHAGEPYFTPSDTRYVQRVGKLYIYGSSIADLMLPTYRR